MRVTLPALAIYLMAGEALPELATAAVRGGATVVEVGIPFSDPLADGPTIQAAGQAALDAGMTPRRCLDVLAETRAAIGSEIPLVPMTYAAIVERYGVERFCSDAGEAGATGLIVADIPPEEAGELADAPPRRTGSTSSSSSRSRAATSGSRSPPAPATASSTSSPRSAPPAHATPSTSNDYAPCSRGCARTRTTSRSCAASACHAASRSPPCARRAPTA